MSDTERLEAPTRRLKIELELGADDLDEAARALRSIAHDLEYEGKETRFVTSGGWGSGYHFACILMDDAMTGDLYREQLEAWRLARVAERQAAAPAVLGVPASPKEQAP